MANPNRPTAVLVIAILHFIFGGLGILGTVCGGIIIFGAFALLNAAIAQAPPNEPEVQALKDLLNSMQSIPGVVPFFAGSMVVGLILAIVLVAAGFGLLKMRNWARTASIIYAVVSILVNLASTGYQTLVFNPAVEKASKAFEERMEEFAKTKGRPGPKQTNPFAGNPMMGAGGNIAGAVIGLIVSCAYPVAILIVLNRANVRAAFARAGRGESPYEAGAAKEEDDFGYDRRDYGGDQGY
jgi:hypothetical protein